MLLLYRVMAAPYGSPTTELLVNVGYHVSLNGSGHSETVATSWDRVPFLWWWVFGRYVFMVSIFLRLVYVSGCTLIVPFSWGDSPRGGRWGNGQADTFHFLTLVPQFLVLRVKRVKIRNWELDPTDLWKYLYGLHVIVTDLKFHPLSKEMSVWVWAFVNVSNVHSWANISSDLFITVSDVSSLALSYLKFETTADLSSIYDEWAGTRVT